MKFEANKQKMIELRNKERQEQQANKLKESVQAKPISDDDFFSQMNKLQEKQE